ncbi:hypothetical protein [Streptomyces sp. ISL-11]|uniref:hypothetical protein n=1 Tax=Streptomyces sp. ISL-11 TaxID=2819174 RepID=UPI0027E4C651|nr:hypothetical protein [Streptomyces sp. ISL-11]
MVGETVVIRSLAAAAAAAAVVGAVLMRRWDRSAGKRVAQLTAARVRDEWKTDERIAELETELEEARAARATLEGRLRGKRTELARLRTEHADLLRRYATAETERAGALESSRVARGILPRSRAAKALETGAPAGTPGSYVAASAYRKAAEALRDLESNAARQRRAAEEAERSKTSATEATGPVTELKPVAPAAERPRKAEPTRDAKPAKAAKPLEFAKPAESVKKAAKAAQDAAGSADGSRPAPITAQLAARRPASRTQGGFDFFGTQRPLPARPVEETDLADVVGEEALAQAEAESAGEGDAKDGIIDLTAHDETEQIDVAHLRSAIS